jgi:hypothetical protein
MNMKRRKPSQLHALDGSLRPPLIDIEVALPCRPYHRSTPSLHAKQRLHLAYRTVQSRCTWLVHDRQRTNRAVSAIERKEHIEQVNDRTHKAWSMDVPDLNMSPPDEPEAQAKPDEAQAEHAVKFTGSICKYSNCKFLQCIMHNLQLMRSYTTGTHHNVK